MKKSILFACLCWVVSVFGITSVDAGKLKKVKVTAARYSILILYTYGPRDAGIFKKHGIDLEIDVRPFKGTWLVFLLVRFLARPMLVLLQLLAIIKGWTGSLLAVA